MQTMLMLLAAAIAGGASPSPQWTHGYGQAMREAREAGKPLAIFVGSGPQGYGSVCEGGELSSEAARLLAERYICVYVDITQPNGQSLAVDFEAGRAPLIVLSDRSATHQAFRNREKLTDARLVQTLEQYSAPTAAWSLAPPPQPVTSYSAPARGGAC